MPAAVAGFAVVVEQALLYVISDLRRDMPYRMFARLFCVSDAVVMLGSYSSAHGGWTDCILRAAQVLFSCGGALILRYPW
jgi:hypothetical protein